MRSLNFKHDAPNWLAVSAVFSLNFHVSFPTPAHKLGLQRFVNIWNLLLMHLHAHIAHTVMSFVWVCGHLPCYLALQAQNINCIVQQLQIIRHSCRVENSNTQWEILPDDFGHKRFPSSQIHCYLLLNSLFWSLIKVFFYFSLRDFAKHSTWKRFHDTVTQLLSTRKKNHIDNCAKYKLFP